MEWLEMSSVWLDPNTNRWFRYTQMPDHVIGKQQGRIIWNCDGTNDGHQTRRVRPGGWTDGGGEREGETEGHVPVAMDDGVEGETVLPWIGEVFDADAGVFGCGPLRPPEKSFSRCKRLVLPHHDIWYLRHNKQNESVGIFRVDFRTYSSVIQSVVPFSFRMNGAATSAVGRKLSVEFIEFTFAHIQTSSDPYLIIQSC